MTDIFVLGISLCENASATLVKNGKVVAHILRERLSGIKNHYGLDFNTINTCLDEGGCDVSQVNFCGVVANNSHPALMEDIKRFSILKMNDIPSNSFSCQFSTSTTPGDVHNDISRINSIEKIPEDIKKFLNLDLISQNEWELIWFPTFLIQNLLEYKLYRPMILLIDNHKVPSFLIYHHLAYAASSYYSSGFDRSLILTHDSGIGKDSGFLFKGQGRKIEPITPHGLECLRFSSYAAEKCGVKSSDSAASNFTILGMYEEDVLKNMLPVGLTYRSRLEQSKKQTLYDCLSDKLIKENKLEINLPLLEAMDSKEFVFSAQLMLERSIIKLLSNFRNDISVSLVDRNLCLSGPVALNCRLNTILWKSREFSAMHVGPYPDETGLSVGAAQFLYYNLVKKIQCWSIHKFDIQSVFLGKTYNATEIYSALRKFSSKISFRKESNWPNAAALDIYNNHIVGLYRDRSEAGPRALGNRTIIANPTIVGNVVKMNKIKKRVGSPYASIILQEELSLWLKGGPDVSPFLNFSYKVREDKRSAVPAIVHTDGTARVQTINSENNDLYALVTCFKDMVGVPIVMKTSLNESGKAMIDSPLSAIEFLLNTSLDVLYINNYRLEKKY